MPVDWPAPAAVHAWQTLRRGGVSAPPFDGFNLALHVGDTPAAVAHNRALLARSLALPSPPCWLEQVHGTAVAEVDREPPDAVPRADAAVSRTPGRVCALLTADCLPVLLCDRAGEVVAAAHAGWRGLAGGVLEATVAAMDRPPAELMAWLGPGISQPAFEVGAEVRACFLARAGTDAAAVEAAFRPNARGRWQADLQRLAALRLQALGIGAVHRSGACTFSDAGRFFSYRRDGTCGRMASLIWLA